MSERLQNLRSETRNRRVVTEAIDEFTQEWSQTGDTTTRAYVEQDANFNVTSITDNAGAVIGSRNGDAASFPNLSYIRSLSFMPRTARSAPAGQVYHVLNRSNGTGKRDRSN